MRIPCVQEHTSARCEAQLLAQEKQDRKIRESVTKSCSFEMLHKHPNTNAYNCVRSDRAICADASTLSLMITAR
eukprot:1771742-Pleurochrysis_carterae.AAC.2